MKNCIKEIIIEISGVCNAKCPYCAQDRLRKNSFFGKIMPFELFSKILNHLIKIKAIPQNRVINFYNWGEPFLYPEINKILEELKKKNLKANFSSNFISLPDFDKKLLPMINGITLSLSGFSQKNYEKIHGASLEKVLNNFEKLYKILREHSPNTMIYVAWHRYTFNENEFWKAHKYFNRPGVFLQPTVAYLNDGIKFRDFIEKKLPEKEVLKIGQDILVDYINKKILYHKKRSKNYYCPQWDYLVISETGELLLCCGYTRYDDGYVLGNVLDMSLEEILNKKLSNPLCKRCISCGIAGFVNGSNMSFPSGGKIKDRVYYNAFKNFFWIRKLPGGEKFARTMKELILKD